MSEKLIKPYEISVWDDELTQIEGSNPVEYKFVEKKLAVIGSDTMTGLNKVYDPVFHKNVNGEKTLTFSLKYKYFDPYTGTEGRINPFAALLVNERKVKLHYDNKWYDFIVKEHSESSEEYEWTYTCSDAFVLELSKTGYNITFDAELNNNQGTARELAKETIKDTDWRLGGAQVGKQLVAEPIYNATLLSTTGINIINTSDTEDSVPTAGSNIYVFYSYVKNKDGRNVQFIIRDIHRQYTIDDKNVITDTNFRITTELTYDEKTIDSHLYKGFWKDNTLIISYGAAETKYQANRLVYNQLTTYDSVMERTVDRFKAGDREIYRYTDYTYTTSNVITNLFTNGDNFNVLEDGSLQGWNPYTELLSGQSVNKLELVTKPELGTNVALVDLLNLSEIEGYLKVKFNGPLTIQNGKVYNTVFNNGIKDNASLIGSISKGDKFVLRWRAGTGGVNNYSPSRAIRALVAKYTQDDPNPYSYYYKHINASDIILKFEGTSQILNNIISGGTLQNNSTEYVIDGVVQTPSTKYLYKHNNTNYVWNGTQQKYVVANDSNYHPYYYVTATATKSVSNKALTNSDDKYGIFIYSIADDITSAGRYYYIQDIQLTRFVPDGADPTGNTPVLIGNVPTATSTPKDYYYIKPADGTAAEDVETYTSPEELTTALNISDEVEALYNEDSEKNLSISVSQSNCFDILQTIAETFECWIDLVVNHDSNGYITSDEYGLEKYIYLREYAGKDNWAGFKYGINLKSIERNVNSDEFVTKLIVDQSQSEYTDEGYVSIASASSNISGESYILNFDYYYNQGLLDRDIAEADKIKFCSEVAAINEQIVTKEKERRELELSLVELESRRNVYAELVDSAQDMQSQALDDFQAITGQTYQVYKNLHPTLDSDNQLTEKEEVLEILSELYVSSATINSYSGLLVNTDQEYWGVRKKLRGSENYSIKIWTDIDDNEQRHVIIELSDYLVGFSFTLGSYTGESTVSKKYFDITSTATSISFAPPSGHTVKNKDNNTITSYLINDFKVAKFKIVNANTFNGVEDEIDDLREQKEVLIKDFNNKYSRFIQEGTWNSTDYIDSELYYLDALQISNTSAQPAISYTINVVEISQLEGFEWYLFDTGDKSYVEDTEFFGWANVDGVLTPAREEVIVSEVEWHLEKPDENVITVQNYKTRFEDLFQRISAAVQTVQYNEATYAKISSLLDANGTINQNVLLQSLNNLAGKEYNLTSNGSIMIQDDVILVQNLTNPANRVIINSEGIRFSSDGGNTWTTAIDGYGINIGAVYTGTLNTKEITIGNKDNPSFRWDRSGISAFGTKTIEVDGEEIDVADLQTYVRFDQNGLYGVKDGGAFKFTDPEDIFDKAHFGITWDGFFIKNNYTGGGSVRITSDNDFQVLKSGGDEKIKIGALEWTQNDTVTTTPIDGIEPSLYGIRIKNDAGDTVFKTGDNGNLEITGKITATSGDFLGGVNVGNTSNNYILIDGVNSLIRSSNYQDGAGLGWKIDKNGDAVFNNITARGAIKTAVFEYAEIQSVGGIFIFRPSSTIRSAAVNGNDIVVTVEKPALFKVGEWCKISNYSSGNDTIDGEAANPDATNILLTNGLTHVYQISSVSNNNITLSGAKALLTELDRNADILVGGALIDMGNKNNTSNYGIGINSSDNTVNLPARAISLFETVINENQNPKVTYNYRAILGTLPQLSATDVNTNIYNTNMAGSQGIYTDNMYIGDKNQYIAFYTDRSGVTPQKKLKISAQEIIYEVDSQTGEETTWDEHISDEIDNVTPITVEISSNVGNMILRLDTLVTLTCTVKKGNTDITNQVSTFTWSKLDRSGNVDPDWSAPNSGNQITIAASDIYARAIFICEVTL